MGTRWQCVFVYETLKHLLSSCQRPCMLLTACFAGSRLWRAHIASRAKRRSVETQHCLWNVQCALRKLKNVICEVSFSSDSNEKDETVLEICYANYENLNWICTRLIEFACLRAFVVKQCPLFVWRNNRITGLLIINICCPLLSGHDALYSANDFCCAKSCYWFVK